MYDDPTHLRSHEIKVRLSDDELELVNALARFNRRQRAAFLRELLLDSASRVATERNAQRDAG